MIGGPPISAMPAGGPTAIAYVPPKLQPVRTAEAPRAAVRAQTDDRAPQLHIPTPEELGLAAHRPAAGDEAIDWSAVERTLDAAGVTGYQVEKTAGGFRFTCQLASGAVSGRGASKAEAVRQALAQIR